MANFVEELWNSIFTPGPTPTLLIATNASFAALQVVFLALLFYTYSIHFLILSILCGGLWYSINWFATELLKEQENERKRRADSSSSSTSPSTQTQVGSGDETTDTKLKEKKSVSDPSTHQPIIIESMLPPKTTSAKSVSTHQQATVANTSGRDSAVSSEKKSDQPVILPPAKLGSSTDLRRRRPSFGDSSDYVGTDSEWEKVSEVGEQ